jgi:competence protein ComFC
VETFRLSRGACLVDSLQSLRESAIDFIYPKSCAGCGRRGTWLCAECDATLERFRPPWCPRCGVPDAFRKCRCAVTPHQFTAVRSVGPFDGWLRGAIVQFKYHGEWGRAEALSTSLAKAMTELLPCDGLVPVPLHPSRMRQRGFNQSLMLAEQVARELGLDVSDVLVRRKRTSPQASLGASGRQINVQGAFAMRADSDVKGHSIILVDDVITTGATLAACAETLRHGGAASVAVATLAREL